MSEELNETSEANEAPKTVETNEATKVAETVETPKPAESTASIETKTPLDSVKCIIKLTKDKKYMDACKEGFSCGKNLYDKHLKDQYVDVKGKKIPRTAIAIAAVFLLYLLSPSCGSQEAPKTVSQASSEIAAPVKAIENNTYNKDGLKVYDLKKCDRAICGNLENSSEDKYSKVSINVQFLNDQGEAIYDGFAEAEDVQPMSRMELSIPSEEEFVTFKLKDVVAEK